MILARELALQNGSSAGIMDGLYGQLTESMPTFQKQGLDYITGEQAISRLNDALGVDGWDFAVKRIWLDREADCVMCIGALTVRWPNGISSTHEDIGSQMPNRKKDGSFVELGSDFKGARTDCLKRCAADIGVGLWLYHKQAGSAFERGQTARSQPNGSRPQQATVADTQAPVVVETPRARLLRIAKASTSQLTVEQRDALKARAVELNLPPSPAKAQTDDEVIGWIALIEEATEAAKPF